VAVDEFDAVFDVNVRAPYFLVADLAPRMAEHGAGAIINISTMVANYGQAGMSLYGVSKAAIQLLTKTWAAEFGPAGVRVNAVSPGPTATEGTTSMQEMDHYRAPFAHAGEDRRPTLSWPRNIPIDGQPADVVSVVEDYSRWLAETDVPKLFINAEPGALIRGRIRELIRTWPNLTETTVRGTHFIQEDSPDEIGAAVAEFVRTNGAT
jgi:NAD(P)-dependent dehydrogenase (short-subunit alcohol dehydrogenase family)